MDILEAIEMLSLNEEEKEVIPDLSSAYDLAIPAMKKQIPIKPQKKGRIPGTCVCGALISGKSVYCWKCGQKIDWD